MKTFKIKYRLFGVQRVWNCSAMDEGQAVNKFSKWLADFFVFAELVSMEQGA